MSSLPVRHTVSNALENWLLFACALLALVFAGPWEHPLPAAAVALFVFALVQILLPACRPVKATPLCPWNWVLMIFGCKLVLLPLAEVLGGVAIGELPHLPSDGNMNLALLLDTLAYLATALAYNALQSLHSPGSRRGQSLQSSPSAKLIAAYLTIGLLGVWWFFGDLPTLLMYFREPEAYLLLQARQAGGQSSWTVAGSTFMRPFLGFAVVLTLCRTLDAADAGSKFLRGAWASLLVVLAALSFTVFSYNRAAFVMPMLATCAVLLARAQRYRVTILTVTLLAGFLLVALSTMYRATHGRTDLASTFEDWRRAGHELQLFPLLQVYGNGPQFLGFLLEETEEREPDWGRGLLAAVMSPVPVLGKDFRGDSGTALYNRLLNRGNAEDQVICFTGELYLGFHVPGILAGFALLGAILSRLQNAFTRAQTSIAVYVIQLTAIWVSFLVVGSLNVVSQIAIYFYWPVFFSLLVQKAQRSLSPAARLATA